MSAAIGEVIPLAVAIAISPIPIIAAILILFSQRARVNGPMFLAGWVAGLTAVFLLVFLLAEPIDVNTDEDSSDAVSWLLILLGAGCLLLAYREWQSRPGPGEDVPIPKWMSGVDTMTPWTALKIGALLSGVNPKALVFALGAALRTVQADLGTAESTIVSAVFIALASVSVAGPVGMYLVGGKGAERVLNTLKAWLLANANTIMMVLFLVFAALLIGKGIGPLFD